MTADPTSQNVTAMTTTESTDEYTGFKWTGLSKFEDSNPYQFQQRASALLDSVNWEALCDFASKLNDGKKCTVLPPMGMGGRHMVRILKFEDGSRWIARLKLSTKDTTALGDEMMKSEVDCLTLVKDRTTMPVPRVFGSMYKDYATIGAPVMLMECLPGNVGTDLNYRSIPAQYKSKFFEEMARCQAEMSSSLFPKIGSISRLEDGSYEIGPIPWLGGPFETATEYLKAWASKATFPIEEDFIRMGSGEFADEIIKSVAEFPGRIADLAERIAKRNHGPFPLRHIDFGHNNIVVDDEYNILGVIDWEGAFAAPWEIVDFPLTLHNTPAPMDVPDFYDENGVPKDEGIRARLAERRAYVEAVRRAEQRGNLPPTLSEVLADQVVQDVATAMRSFTDPGKMGLYSRLLDLHYKDTSTVSPNGLGVTDVA
ncbi:MAG: hypothetical protein M1816_000996 [Peltula sp. TS41687]|nr:MAG: hypothetical protein M1816_000996 [Peltula sp. TS41687]